MRPGKWSTFSTATRFHPQWVELGRFLFLGPHFGLDFGSVVSPWDASIPRNTCIPEDTCFPRDTCFLEIGFCELRTLRDCRFSCCSGGHSHSTAPKFLHCGCRVHFSMAASRLFRLPIFQCRTQVRGNNRCQVVAAQVVFTPCSCVFLATSDGVFLHFLVLSVQGSPFECDRSQLQSIGCRDVQSPMRQASLFLDCSCAVAVALVETSWLHVSPDVFSKHRFRKAMPIVLSRSVPHSGSY